MMRILTGQCLFLRRRIAFTLIGVSVPIASPAIAGCLGHPDQNFCYIANVEITHNSPTYFDLPVRASGDTPQSVAAPHRSQASASASSDGAHNGTLTVHTEVDDDDYYLAYAEAGLSYTFRLASKDSSVPPDPFVPLNVQAIAFTLRNQFQFQGNASIELDQNGSEILYAAQTLLDDPRATILFDVNRWINVQPDDDILVKLFVDSSVDSSPGYGRFSSGVFLDPTYTIAPDYASRYTLVGLPEGSITPPGVVPEPATWAMMVGGFGLISGAMRRRRKAVICLA